MRLKTGLPIFVVMLSFIFLIAACDDDGGKGKKTFTLTLENVSDQFIYSASGVFNTPDGAGSPGPILPGQSYSFSFKAAGDARLSFATMFVQSNDLFVAPDGAGIALFNAGTPISGDVTAMIELWDAGTEVNEEPGVGANQAPRQSGPNTGADENGVVQLVSAVGDGFNYPPVADIIQVTITPTTSGGITTFDVELLNISDGSILESPFAPGVFVVHTADDPLFTDGSADRNEGLEGLAEDGTTDDLFAALDPQTGIATPFAPGVVVVSGAGNILFTENQADPGEGLEGLAEDGTTADLITALGSKSGVVSVVGFQGPIGPGGSEIFTFEAGKNDFLMFATMFVQSNDLFLAPDDTGIGLFPGGSALSGDITSMIELWDAGTEANEEPGLGPNQAPRQTGANTGPVDANAMVRLVADGYDYPAVSDLIRATLSVQ